MPDDCLADQLIATCHRLVSPQDPEPTEADLRRAISTAYFASFHALAQISADGLVGDDVETRPRRAWVEVYRGLSHGPCSKACEKAKSIGFPEEIEGFADNFVQLQIARKRVDYDPTCQTDRETAQLWIAMAEVSIRKLFEADNKSKIAFATWVLITSPGASLARSAVRDNIGPDLGGPTN